MMTFVISVIAQPVRIISVCVTEDGLHELAKIVGGSSTDKSLLLAHEKLGIKLAENTNPHCVYGVKFTRLRPLIPGGYHQVNIE